MDTRLFLSAILCGFVYSAQSQFLNGNFQIPGSSTCDAGANWTVPTGSNAPQYVVDGSNSWIDITPCNGFGNGSYIEQTINTTLGLPYYIEFDLATTYGWQIWDSGIDVYINGTPLNVGTNRVFHNTFNTSQPGANHWKTLHSNSFIASGSTTQVRLVGNGANPQNPSYIQGGVGPGVMGLDNVVLKQGSLTSIKKQSTNNLVLSPNPADQSFKITNASSRQEIKLLDINGKTMISRPYLGEEINCTELSNGLYFLIIETENEVYTQKLIIQH